jgi:hypothetical protein
MASQESWGTLRMRELVTSWLDGHPIDDTSLDDWLVGTGLPAVGDADEPYVWILRGLPVGGDRPPYERTLALRAGGLLDAQSDAGDHRARDPQYVYNLLMLSAGLSSPDELHDPLERMMRRGLLDGTWDGSSLRAALRASIIENQIDSRLFPVWRGMLRGKPDELLGGTPFDGFTGISLMPASREDRGNPNHFAISEGLVLLACYLDGRANGPDDFRNMVDRMLFYPDRPLWSAVLLLTIARDDLPQWAAMTLGEALATDSPADLDTLERAFFRICSLDSLAWAVFVGALRPLLDSGARLEHVIRRLIRSHSPSMFDILDRIPERQWMNAATALRTVVGIEPNRADASRFSAAGDVNEISSFASGVTIVFEGKRYRPRPSSMVAEMRLYEMLLQTLPSSIDPEGIRRVVETGA